MSAGPTESSGVQERRRELGYWWALVSALGNDETKQRLGALMKEHVADLEMPKLLLDPRASVAQVVKQSKRLEGLMRLPHEADGEPDDPDDGLRQQLLVLKGVVNVFGAAPGESVSAEQYSRWLADVRAFEQAAGYRPGTLLTGRGSGTGGGREVTTEDVEEALDEMARGRGLLAEPEIQAGLRGIEKRLIDRMALADILKDAKLAAAITPSMAMVEQLLRQKGDLSGTALANAKRIIRRYIDDLRDLLQRQVESTPTGRIDRSVPPKRTFRNLDLKRTLWANLVNWDPGSQQLIVDRLYYRHTARHTTKHRMIVVVDQSGSMVPAMVNCTILASIFAGLPAVDAHLVAYDTEALDLSAWVGDPFEVLLRTQLGGGTDGMCAVPLVQAKIADPRKTVLVWISDFYDNRELLPVFRGLHQGGVTFIPVGSVSTSGYFSVDGWFRKELKQMGRPILSGSLKTLIRELKSALP